VQAAGIKQLGGPVSVLELEDAGTLADDEILLEVNAAGAGNWDEIVRTGGWDIGAKPPMALGVQAAGVVVATGQSVLDLVPGDGVLTHPLPLRHQGAWAERLVAPAITVARKPASVSWEAAGAFPVPALTAEQLLSDVLSLTPGTTVLVHGAGGVTGGLIVQLAAFRGMHVIATAGASSRTRVRELGARAVLDRADLGWTSQVRELTVDGGVPVAINAARGGASTAMTVVADGGRLATITSDPPPDERGISVSNVYVRPDGRQLSTVVELLGDQGLTFPPTAAYGLEDAGRVLELVAAASIPGPVVLRPGSH
jgi:NADPH:quinone reductase-like Zn-dependent oxidoreductase